MASDISYASFIRLLEDDVFVDYLNKFCSLPVFGQRVVYRKKLLKCVCEPNFFQDVVDEDVLKWIWESRLPFFFRSHIYAEYKLAKALIDYDLNEDGGVEVGLANGMERLKCHSFSKMSRFSKFCKFLSETGEGLKLVAFFIAAQHVFVGYYQGDPDFAIQIGELRDKFFDETSYWCLPPKVLENSTRSDQSTSVAFCMTVSQRVLSRICLYWLPRYLLQLRMNEMSKQNPTEVDGTRQYLHDLIFRVQDMEPEAARKSVSMLGFKLLSINPLTSNQVAQNSSKYGQGVTHLEVNGKRENLTSSKMSLSDFFPSESTTDIESRQRDRSMTSHMLGKKKVTSSIAIPGCDIKVERKKSKRPTMLQLSTAVSIGIQLNSGTDLRKKEHLRQTRIHNKDNISDSGRNTNISRNTMRKPINMRNMGVSDRLSGVSKAITKFKLARDSQISAAATTQRPPPSSHKSEKSMKINRPKVQKEEPIKEQPKNVIKFNTAKLNKYEPDHGKSDEDKLSIKKSTRKFDNEDISQPVTQKPPASIAPSVPSIPPSGPPKFGTVIMARSLALKWKKGAVQKLNNDEEKTKNDAAKKQLESKKSSNAKKSDNTKTVDLPNKSEPAIRGLKMVFSMSDQREDENKTIKVLTKKNNRLMEDFITENEVDEGVSDDQPLPNQYVRNRRNAQPKIKPAKTLRKRPHSQLPTSAAEKQEQKRTVQQTKLDNDQGTPFEKQLKNKEGQRKANFIKKALMVNTIQECIKAPDRSGDDYVNGYGDNYSSAVYSVHEDLVFRHEMRYLRAALRSDDFAAGPFMAYLTETQHDEAALFALCFWQEVERFRDEFSCMQQSDLILTMDQILTKYVLNDRGYELIPGMKENSFHVMRIDIFSCLTFPWSLRLLQRKSMEYLKHHWEMYIIHDTTTFYKSINMLDEVLHRITGENVSKLVRLAFQEQAPPVPRALKTDKYEHDSNRSSCGMTRSRRTTLIAPVSKNSRRSSRFTTSGLHCVNMDKGPRSTLGYRVSQMHGHDRSTLQATAMARRSYRAYLLAEQTCRLTAKMPQTDNFVCDESDEEGFVKPKPPAVFLRAPTLDMKTLSLMSAKEYPSKSPMVKKMAIIRAATKEKPPTYMQVIIRKNGVNLKRPMLRPKHLVDCLRDPVHYEFFRRFAKTYHFERSVRFWKAVEVMKHIEDPRIRQSKIRVTVNQFFAKGATTGVGVDGQVLREIMRTPPDKVTVSMLISAQACVMKALDDLWGERYLSTFPDVKRNQAQKTMDRTREEIMKMTQSNGQMTSIWRVFYAFIKRSAKFISTMKRRHLRQEFELYLQTVGRDPTVYQNENWSEICATSHDIHMNPEVMFHQKKQQGRHVIAELLINDFRFWCEVECYRSQAKHVQQNGDDGMYDPIDEEILHEKAKLICDQFLNSPIPPKCRINIQSELSSTVIENVKLGMFNRSLFHDLTINIFPLLLNYWKIFCERRHKYVPRCELQRFKHELVLQRRDKLNKIKKKVPEEEIELLTKKSRQMEGDAPLIDYCSNKRFSNSWMDITKSLEEIPVMNFSLAAGVKLTIPLKSMKSHVPKTMSTEQPI